jgi:lipid-A-disaccharide synthase-like uncharacterized protein
MTAGSWAGAVAAPVVAFQVWDAVGWLGQAVFTVRVLHQWWASERAKRSVVPPSFWTWSLLGTAALAVYAVHRADPVFLAGTLVNGFIYARNRRLAMRERQGVPPRGSALLPVALGVVAFGAVTAWSALHEGPDIVTYDASVPWLAVGFLGQGIWSGRFVVQWWASERAGRSLLPASFFWMSIAGATLLFAYAVHRVDWVFMAAYALNPIPYARNLVLLRRARRAGTVRTEEGSSA